MDPDDARYLKRKVKGGNIDVHPSEKALVVNYEVEAIILGEQGNPMLGDKKECEKVIHVRHLNDSTDIENLAKEIISKCHLIHPSKLPEVEQLLYYLQKRKGDTLPPPKQKGLKKSGDLNPFDTEIESTANVNDIEEYMELLYEEMPEKIQGSSFLLQLARNPDNLEEIFQNESLVGALARVLRDDWKKNTELATNIVYVFFCFSMFTQFHGVISHFKIGALCVEIVKEELDKYDKLKVEEAKAGGDEKRKQRIADLLKKQEQLIRVSIYLLLNLSEDVKVEMKMKSKNIVGILSRLLDRDNYELLILAVSFLKKLSIFIENKNEMVNKNVIEKLEKILSQVDPQEQMDLLSIIFRLLLNLSFDIKVREQIVRVGLLPKLVGYMDLEPTRQIILCILYHLSMDDKCRSMFGYSEQFVPSIVKLLFESSGENMDFPLVALCINLASNRRCTELLCGENGTGLTTLMKRSFKYKDVLFMKIVRNISQHSGPTKEMFVDYLEDVSKGAMDASNEDFQVECLGALCNLIIPDLDYEVLADEFQFIPWIKKGISDKETMDDIKLEQIMLAGVLCHDEGSARMVAEANMVPQLIVLLNERQEDDEIVLQILYVFYQLIFRQATRSYMIEKTQAVDYFVDLMHDKNSEIKKLCDHALDIVAEHDQDWAKKIQKKKFQWHNQQWLDMVESGETDEQDVANIYGDDELGPFIHDADLIDQFYGHAALEAMEERGSPDLLMDSGNSFYGYGYNQFDPYDRPMTQLDFTDNDIDIAGE